MPQREWEKSKMKIKTSEGILKKEKMSHSYESSFDYNDNCKFKHQLVPNQAFLDSLEHGLV